MKWSWAAVSLACIAAIVNPLGAPLWLFIGLITASMTLTAIGLIIVQRRVKRQELEWKMEKAFGKPPKRAWTAKDLDTLKGGFQKKHVIGKTNCGCGWHPSCIK